jgi:hypothetical protein
MAKNRFAQPLYGKIVYIFETDLEFEELSTIFDPSVYWIDVTHIECEVGYLVDFKEGVGLILVPPPKEPELPEPPELTLDELRVKKLEEIHDSTRKAIIGGFTMVQNDLEVEFDSDVDTQRTMTIMYNASQSPDFETTEPYNGLIPCRGKIKGNDYKTIFYLDKKDIQRFQDSIAMHVGACKRRGWELQAMLDEAITREDIEKIQWSTEKRGGNS